MLNDKYVVVGFGSKIEDTTVTLAENSSLTSAALKKIINEEIRQENQTRAAGDQIPEIAFAADLTDDRLFPVFQRVIEKIQSKHSGALELHVQEGGSVYNTFAATKAILGEDAEKVTFHFIPASFANTIIFVIDGKKDLATTRPAREGVRLKKEDLDILPHADAVFLPNSSFKGYPSIVDQIKEVASQAKILGTFHGGKSDDPEVLKTMAQSDALIGSVGETPAPEAIAPFYSNPDAIQIITDGENGLYLVSQESGKWVKTHYPTVPQKNPLDPTGAGNGSEAALFAYLLGFSSKDALGDLANAAGRTALGFIGATLSREHHSQIDKNFYEIRAHRLRPETSRTAPTTLFAPNP